MSGKWSDARRRLCAPPVATGRREIGTDNPSMYLFTVNHFTVKQRVALTMFVAKDNIIPFRQFFGL